MSLSLFKAKSFIGIDLGAKTLKAVQMERTQAGWRIARSVVQATPRDSIKEGVVVDTESVSEALRSMLRSAHISASSAVIGVAGASVIVRNVRIPKMAEATLRKSIRFEAGRYVPSSIEDSYIEFEIVGDAPDGLMDVIIVACPKDIVESRMRAVEAAGLEVEIVDVEAFAMYRSLIESNRELAAGHEAIAIIDVGASATNVSVVSQGIFTMTRAIPQAGQTLTDALRNYFKLSEEDAEEGKAQLDLRTLADEGKPAENPPLRVIQPHVDELIREIRRSLNYYQSQQTEQGTPNPVTKILVSGGGAGFAGLSGYMSKKLGVETVCAGVLDNPRFIYTGAEELGQGLNLGVASGLAMRPFAKAA